jgi:hypothetical protein
MTALPLPNIGPGVEPGRAISDAFSAQNQDLLKRLEGLKLKPASLGPGVQVINMGGVPFNVSIPAQADVALEERLYDVRAFAKIKTRAVASHLDSNWQRRLFEQLDDLHDVDSWEDVDIPMHKESYSTFLTAMLSIRPTVVPGLGLTHDGNLLGTWGRKGDSLTMEFKAGGLVRWTLSCLIDGQQVRTATEVPLAGLQRYLAPYNPAHWWFRDGREKAAS